jgi:hypothetical protein
MSWGTVLKLLVLAFGLRVIWDWEDDPEEEQPDDPEEPGDHLEEPAVPRSWSYADPSARPRHRRVGPLP